jgi:glucan-binding YG repeat protein
MIEEHADPTAEAHAQASNLMRTLLTALATVADRRAQRRQADQERQRHQKEAERQEFEKRIDAERESAYLVYRRVYDKSWWASPSPRKVADAVVAAGTWAAHDPRARDAWAELSEQLQSRYRIDLEALARQPAGTNGPVEQVASGVREQVDQAQRARPQAEQPGAGTLSGSTTGQAAASARRWEAEVVQVAGAKLGAQIIAAEAWYHLQNRLDKYQAAGEDPLGHLSDALAEGGLATANDKSRVLISRMNHPGRYRVQLGRPLGKHTRPPDAEHLAQRRRADRERHQDRLEPGGES